MVTAEKNLRIKNIYPWGTTWPPPPGAGNFAGEEMVSQEPGNEKKVLAGYRDDFLKTAPVGRFQANFLGLFDLSGNVAEWCEDLFESGKAFRVFRGGTYAGADQAALLSSFRYNRPPESNGGSFGFRVVLAPANLTP